MTDTASSLAKRLHAEGEKTIEFFHSLAPEQWEQSIYTEGTRWSVRSILAHFVSAEFSFGLLIDNILAGGPGAKEGFDIDEYNERRVAKLQADSSEQLLAKYVQYRQENVERVSQIPDTGLGQEGRHPFLGIASLVEIIKLIYRHNQIHQREIRRALAPSANRLEIE